MAFAFHFNAYPEVLAKNLFTLNLLFTTGVYESSLTLFSTCSSPCTTFCRIETSGRLVRCRDSRFLFLDSSLCLEIYRQGCIFYDHYLTLKKALRGLVKVHPLLRWGHLTKVRGVEAEVREDCAALWNGNRCRGPTIAALTEANRRGGVCAHTLVMDTPEITEKKLWRQILLLQYIFNKIIKKFNIFVWFKATNRRENHKFSSRYFLLWWHYCGVNNLDLLCYFQ